MFNFAITTVGKILKLKQLLSKVQPVILCGGKGERLWPLSREEEPKQFLKIDGKRSLFQNTIVRTLKIFEETSILLITQENYLGILTEQIKSLDAQISYQIITEPNIRNTAPAIALAAQYVKQNTSLDLITVFPSDHHIEDLEDLTKTIVKAVSVGQAGEPVTIGVQPTRADTGYGYIQLGKKQGISYKIESFIEKPEKSEAVRLFSAGGFLWNSGIFVFKPSKLLEFEEKEFSQIAQITGEISKDFVPNEKILKVDADRYQKCPKISIDHAVMEKCKDSHVIPFGGGWSDVGSWPAVAKLFPKDSRNNFKKGDVRALNSKNCIVYADSRLVATVGTKDLSIIETKDAVLVMPNNEAENMRELMASLTASNHSALKSSLKVRRPWGFFESIFTENTYQVKRIIVDPGQALSLQKHKFRFEHWFVVSGEASVRVGDKEQTLREGHSIDIPVGEIHRLTNNTKTTLILIETQIGSYLGEDDIIRIKDNYGRIKDKEV